MNDMKKVLIVAISVVLVIAIAAGVSIGVMANTMNGLKDRVEELDQAYASDKAAMMAEIEAAKAADENLVTAADFEAKLAAALGEQNQTMQTLISTAVKNQIEELETEGLTEAQVQEIIDAAVANCLTEADIDAIVAGVDSGLTKDEVKKIVADYTVGTLTYGQIVDLIDDADYDLRVYLEEQIKAVANAVKDLGGEIKDLEGDVANKTAKITLNAATFTDDSLDLADLVSGGKVILKGDWTGKDLTITCDGAKDFIIDATGITMGVLTINASKSHVEVIAIGATFARIDAKVAPNSLVITGAATIGSVNVEQGRVVVEDATVTEVTLKAADTKLEIGATATVKDVVVTADASGATVANEGTVTGTIEVNAEATVTNEGKVTDITVNADATVTNEGTVTGKIEVNAEATVTNEGTVTGTIEVKAEATVTNNGTAGKIEVTDEKATVENAGKVEEVTGENYVTYDPDKYADLREFFAAAKDGETLCIPEGEYTVVDQITIDGKSINVLGMGEVTITLNSSNNASRKVFYIYGSNVEGNGGINVEISNIAIDGNGSKGDVWLRTWSDSCRGDITLTLENVIFVDTNGKSIFYDNNYSDGTVIDVEIKNSVVGKIILEASPFNGNKIDTYSSVKYDDKTEIGSIVISDGVDDMSHIQINGEVPTARYYVFTADALAQALENGYSVALANDIKIDPANMSNAYGKTGINVKNGQTIDGNGYTIDIKGAGGTWDSGINTTGGLIKNIKVTGSFRGIFVNHTSNHSEKVILENVVIDGTTYTISCDQGLKQGLLATDSTFNGWTSYAGTIGEAEFVDCSFGKGNGYAYCRPYAPTTFTNCEFAEGYKVDPRAEVVFENCYLDGVLITAENLADLVTGNIANASVK